MAVTSMVALSFLIPLGMMVQYLVEVRAHADAERQAAVIAAALTTHADADLAQAAREKLGPEAAQRIAIHNLAEDVEGAADQRPVTVGQGRAQRRQIDFVAAQRAEGTYVEVAGGESYLTPVVLPDARPLVVEVFISDAELTRGVRQAWYALSAVALGLVVASVLVGDRLAAKAVGSARGLADAAGALGDGNLEVRVRPSGPRELVEAGLAFNSMADRVVALLSTERELVADLSHRLRTPLTALRLDAETLDDSRAGERIRHAISALELEIDQLIRAARKPKSRIAEAEESPRTCDASEVVRDRMVFWSAVAGDQGRWCQVVGVDSPAPVPVVRADLAAALDALLGNVCRYTAQGVPFEVAVSRRDGYVAIRVEDGGPGIADPDQALRRGASDKGSTGLGLDIVRRVAVAARGGVNIDRGRLGGASVVVLLEDAERPPVSGSRFGLVGRLSRDPADRKKHTS